jgi:hypothetical protein
VVGGCRADPAGKVAIMLALTPIERALYERPAFL